MAIGDRMMVENFGFCGNCLNGAPRLPAPEAHTETQSAWRCEDCGKITLETAIFECKISEATIIV